MGKLDAVLDRLDNASGEILLSRFDGGLNVVSSNEILEDNEAIIRKNWATDNRGAIRKVNGYTKKNSIAIASKPIRGLFRGYKSDGTKYLLTVCNGTLYYSTDDGTTFTAATSGTGLTETVFNTGVNYNDLFFFTNPTDGLKVYTPGTFTMSAALDQPTNPCKVLLKRADRRMLALGNAVNGSTAAFTKVDPTNSADDWSAVGDAGTIAIDGAKSEPLTGGLTFGSSDIILKSYGAFRVGGYPAPSAQRMPGSPGCAAPYSCAQGDGLGFFLAHDGVWMFDGNKFVKISTPIEDIIKRVNPINPTYIQNAFGVYRYGLYELHYTPNGQTTNTKCLIYDVAYSNPYAGKNIWYERDGLAMNCPVVFNGEGDDNELYAGTSADTGFVYRLDYSASGADDTSDITATYQTKFFNAKLPRVVKRFAKIHISYFLNSGKINVRWYTNRGKTSGSFNLEQTQEGVALGTFLLGTDILASNTEATHTEPLKEDAIGKDISLKFTHTGHGSSPIIREITIEWEALYQQ